MHNHSIIWGKIIIKIIITIFLSSKDALNCSKVTINTFIMLLKRFLLQINVVLLYFLFIKESDESKKKSITISTKILSSKNNIINNKGPY